MARTQEIDTSGPAGGPSGPGPRTASQPWRVWTALGTLYFVWGSTYLAIKVAIDSIPPLLMASTRFLVAGGVLYVWAARTGPAPEERPRLPQWRSAAIVGGALLLMGNGGVVWAEHRGVPTGVVALIVATVPLWMAVIDRVVTSEPLAAMVVVGLLLGFAGLALLVGRSEGRVDALGTALAMVASFSWAAGSVYARRAPLPSRPLLAAGMEMVCGGALLGVVGVASGELSRVDLAGITGDSVLGLAYLIVFGSLVAFSAYVWLLGSARLSLVSTYAYVNPVVAVMLGWLILSEDITARTLLASAVILVAVALIVAARSPRKVVAPPNDAVPCEGAEG